MYQTTRWQTCMTVRAAFCLHYQLLLNAQLCEDNGPRIYFRLLVAMRILLKLMNNKYTFYLQLNLTASDHHAFFIDWKMQILTVFHQTRLNSNRFWLNLMHRFALFYCYYHSAFVHISPWLWFKIPCSNFTFFLNLTRWPLWSQHLDVSHKSNDSKTSGGFEISYRWEVSPERASVVLTYLKKILLHLSESWGFL